MAALHSPRVTVCIGPSVRFSSQSVSTLYNATHFAALVNQRTSGHNISL